MRTMTSRSWHLETLPTSNQKFRCRCLTTVRQYYSLLFFFLLVYLQPPATSVISRPSRYTAQGYRDQGSLSPQCERGSDAQCSVHQDTPSLVPLWLLSNSIPKQSHPTSISIPESFDLLYGNDHLFERLTV